MNDGSVGTTEQAPDSQPRAQSPRWPGWLALLLFCIAGASAAFYATKPLYRGEGLIQFRQPLRALHDEPARIYDRSFIETEAFVARSPAIVDLAMRGTSWAAIGRTVSPA